MSSTEEEDTEVNEWTDEVWRSDLASNSIIKVRSVHPSSFFGSGKVAASHPGSGDPREDHQRESPGGLHQLPQNEQHPEEEPLQGMDLRHGQDRQDPRPLRTHPPDLRCESKVEPRQVRARSGLPQLRQVACRPRRWHPSQLLLEPQELRRHQVLAAHQSRRKDCSSQCEARRRQRIARRRR